MYTIYSSVTLIIYTQGYALRIFKFSKLLEEGINEEGRPLEHHDYSRIAKIVSSKTPLVDAFNEYTDIKQEVEDLQQMILDVLLVSSSLERLLY